MDHHNYHIYSERTIVISPNPVTSHVKTTYYHVYWGSKSHLMIDVRTRTLNSIWVKKRHMRMSLYLQITFALETSTIIEAGMYKIFHCISNPKRNI